VGGRGEGRGRSKKGGGRGKWEEMTQTLYTHMNKRNLKKKSGGGTGDRFQKV
jgi:hypothetical protein